MATGTLPILSEVRAFTGDYLTDAASYWSDNTDRWTERFDGVRRDVVHPGGSDWTGEAAEAAASRFSADRKSVTNAADDLSRAAVAARRAAAKIAAASAELRSLAFGENDTRDSGVMQAVDFHGVPVPEKPAYLPPVPPAEGWSEDPLMRAAQKIAYGHAWDEHRTEFPGIDTKAQFAEFIRQKMQRAIEHPRGLRLGWTKDGVPAIYDPEDNVLIIRDTRTDTTQAGTAFKPDSPNPNYVADKAPLRSSHLHARRACRRRADAERFPSDRARQFRNTPSCEPGQCR